MGVARCQPFLASHLTEEQAAGIAAFTYRHVDPEHRVERNEVARRLLASKPLMPPVTEAMATLSPWRCAVLNALRWACAVTAAPALVDDLDAKLGIAVATGRLDALADEVADMLVSDVLADTAVALLPDTL